VGSYLELNPIEGAHDGQLRQSEIATIPLERAELVTLAACDTASASGEVARKAKALTTARRLSQQRGEPAQVWAAWVLVGDPR
jgi:CHAT domain-containing protein